MPSNLDDKDLKEIRAADDRSKQASIIARSIAEDVQERVGTGIELQGQNGGNTFEILWNGKPSGKLQIFIPRGSYGPERVKFSLQAVRSPTPRTYAKMSTLIDKIINLCRPLTEQEVEIAERRERRRELTERLEAIEGGTGAIGRYMHVHGVGVALWLASLPDEAIPPGLKFLADRMRELVEEAAQLRAEMSELE